MMRPTVYKQFAGLSNWPFGAALSFVLMMASLLLTVTSNWMGTRYPRRRLRRSHRFRTILRADAPLQIPSQTI
jgi:ABC-type spermidine/putrescine transport system permease subunit I